MNKKYRVETLPEFNALGWENKLAEWLGEGYELVALSYVRAIYRWVFILRHIGYLAR